MLKSILNKIKDKKDEMDKECISIVNDIRQLINEAENNFVKINEFIDLNYASNLEIKIKSCIKNINDKNIYSYILCKNYNELNANISKMNDLNTNFINRVKKHNDMVARKRMYEVNNIIGNVEGYKLDDQQLECIAKDAHNHLVIAGAGTGKTTTIIGKIKYLLKSEKYKAEDLLILSFTNATTKEMEERLNREMGFHINVSTFHKLGMDIISEVEGIRPKISNLNLKKFVYDKVIERAKNQKDYFKILLKLLIYGVNGCDYEVDFENELEYERYIKTNPYVTIKGEKLKSNGERIIANFLALNNIRYIYEYPYKIDTRDKEHNQYYPDFYLPDFDIYIEYYGIDRDGNVPNYFRYREGLNPTLTYNESIKWKRRIHLENSTSLIECFSYELKEGILIDNLEKSLKNKSINFEISTYDECIEKETNKIDKSLYEISSLFETIINLLKSNGYDINTLKELNKKSNGTIKNSLIIKCLEPIFNDYCDYLKINNLIDFNDMIILATNYISEGKYNHNYKYVVVDEYQDISKSRFNLLKKLRENSDYELFCVGDDWQSIYRFAGSDVGLIVNFEKTWGPSQISKIETTYRFSEKMAEISGKFIMKNPIQIKKIIGSKYQYELFPLSIIDGYNDKNLIDYMVEKLDYISDNDTVFFIGRYKDDINLIKNNCLFELGYDNQTNNILIKYLKKPRIKIYFLTAHKSKGLQADYVFILNNRKYGYAFPSQTQDEKILALLLEELDSYPYSEERRLFYVALTRCKKKAFLINLIQNQSSFIDELKEEYINEIKKEKYECPMCGGRLIKINGKYGAFFGCSNYNNENTKCKFTRKIVTKKQNNQH